ncbi:hypothetical protein FQR65_LT19873 [Abscondita terminalis]|nr:hypothetical protein FQR65_LT19873 [Abscondita terminalis]
MGDKDGNGIDSNSNINNPDGIPNNKRGITIDCLQWMKEGDLKEIFGMNHGARIKFRGLVNDWRTSNNMDTFLETDIGRKLKKVYDENKMFKMPEKETLVKNIVKLYIDKNIPMTLNICQDIAVQICNKFENESMEYYFTKKPKTSGRLYNRYRSESSSFKRSGLFTGFVREKRKNRTIIEECPTQDTNTDDNTANQIEKKDWLKTRSSPWDAVELKWKESFNLRRKEINTICLD